MSDAPTRRLSTGGKPPVKVEVKCAVEAMKSHDGVPCFTAWDRDEIIWYPQGWSKSEFTVNNKRPKLSIQIYDTTPGSDNLDLLKALAEKLHMETRVEREQLGGRPKHHRLDVWGLSLVADVSQEERVAKCKAHQLSAERAGRRIPRFGCTDARYQRVILVIDRPQELWNEDEGGFLAVYWDVRSNHLEEPGEDCGDDDDPRDETHVERFTRDKLAQELADLRDELSFDNDDDDE